MKITITIRNEQTGKEYDIVLDNQQKIATTLQVLKENLPEALYGIEGTPKLQSQRTSRHLDFEASYEESHIYTGDVIMISQDK